MKNPQSTTAYSLLSNTVHLPIFSDGLKYHSTGQLSSVSYSLTLEASSKIEWYFPCMCKNPRRQTGFLDHRKANPWIHSKCIWDNFLSFIELRPRHYRLTGLCLPKRLLTLRWKVRVNRLECGRGGEEENFCGSWFQNTNNQTSRETSLEKSLLGKTEFLMNQT